MGMAKGQFPAILAKCFTCAEVQKAVRKKIGCSTEMHCLFHQLLESRVACYSEIGVKTVLVNQHIDWFTYIHAL